MTILITGSRGFIGSHFKDLLIEKDVPFKEFSGDILNMSDVQRGLRDADTVVHFAGVTYLPLCMDIDETAMKVNVEGTLNFLRCHSLIKKFVFISSASVYGNQKSFPISEDAMASPLETYSISKLTGEWLVRRYAESFNFQYVIVRLFNVYGPRQSGVFSIPAFFTRAFKEGKITVKGDAERDYVYVKDVVKAILEVTTKKMNADPCIYNIATNKPTHVIDVAEMIGDLCGAEVVQEKSERLVGILKLHGSYEKICKETGWAPELSLEEGLQRIFLYYGKAR